MDDSYVYVWENALNGKSYVGKGRGKRALNLNRPSCRYFYAAIRKHGRDAFRLNYLATGLSDQEAMRLEIHYISAFKTMAPWGYNLTSGGQGPAGRTVSKETREKLRRAGLGRKASIDTRIKQTFCDKNITGFALGRGPKSEETKRRISKGNKGKVRSEKTKTKLRAAATYRAPVSEETRKKQSAKAKGRPQHPNQIAALAAYRERVRNVRQSKADAGVQGCEPDKIPGVCVA